MSGMSGIRTDLAIVQCPVVPPDFGGLYKNNLVQLDPDFGSRIARLTDGASSDFRSMQTADYAGAGIWGRDDTLLTPISTGHERMLYQFNPSRMTSERLPWQTSGTVCFSRLAAGSIFVLNGTVVTKSVFTVVSGIWTHQKDVIVCDFAYALPAGFRPVWNSVFLISRDDTTITAAFSDGPQGTAYLVCTWRGGKGAYKGFRTLNTHTGLVTGDWGVLGPANLVSALVKFPFTLHESYQTPNAAYALLQPNKIDTTLTLNLASGTITDMNFASHKAPGVMHAYAGGSPGGQLDEIAYGTSAARKVVPADGLADDYYGDRHFAFGRTDPLDKSIVWASTGANTPVPFGSAWEGEVFGYRVVDGVVYRACHLYNSFKSKEFIVANGIACPSQTGKFVAFCSDMFGYNGSTSGGADGVPGVDARGDVFIVDVEAAV